MARGGLFGVSAVALSLALAGQAWGQCAPNPTAAGGTTTCTGANTSGFVVNATGTTVNVTAGATVVADATPGTPGLTVNIPVDPASYAQRTATINVDGSIIGATDASGITVLSGSIPPGAYDFSGSSATINVSASGSINGAAAINIAQSSGNPYGPLTVVLDNAGTILGLNSPALAGGSNLAGFTSINNHDAGLIGPIVAPFGTINNSATINGNGSSAINPGGVYLYYGYNGGITNSGGIVTNSASATIANLATYTSVINSGLIRNSGSGAAISSSSLSILNQAGGRIISRGGTAISGESLSITNQTGATITGNGTAIDASGSAGMLTLINAGTINGNITVSPTYAYNSSSIDSTAGTINGNVTFGNGNDTLYATISGGALATGITGSIDGGGGTNTVVVRQPTSITLSNPFSLPNNFTSLSLAPASDATVTLASGFSLPGLLTVNGSGSVINQGSLSGAGTLVNVASGSFTNSGTITATPGSYFQYAVTGSLTNSGTISAAPGMGGVGGANLFGNSGTIQGGDTGVNFLGDSFTNSGTISASSGTGLQLAGFYNGASRTNSGTITGQTVGAELSTTLVNTGTISSPGIGVQLDYFATLDNRAGGVVSGGSRAISLPAGGFGYANTVLNAGTINGDVNIASAPYTYGGNVFVAEAGGMLNGNLALGNNDTLVVQAGATPGAGGFAGISGTVSASNSNLRYQVASDLTLSGATMPAGFTSVGFELLNNATLTASFPTPLGNAISLAGNGTVNLAADITTTDAAALLSTQPSYAPAGTGSTALTITSSGTITATRSASGMGYMSGAVQLGGQDRFTNTGTITVTDQQTLLYGPAVAAISGGQSVSNSGTINVGNAVAISSGLVNGLTVSNSGSILQQPGTAPSVGLDGGYSLLTLGNSGTIQVAGHAVQSQFGSLNITNSGTITSTATQAISSGGLLTLANQAGGRIAGAPGQAAILANGATISNAGTITGPVDLSWTPYGGVAFTASRYNDQGGTLAGDLTFGAGNDALVETTGHIGVTGVVDGGAGVNTFGHSRSTTATVTLGIPAGLRNFTEEMVEALGSGTTVTIAGSAPASGNLTVGGDGNLINTVNLSGQLLTPPVYFSYPPVPVPVPAQITNQATIAGAVITAGRFANSGTAGTVIFQGGGFSNSGTVGSASLNGQAVIQNGGAATGFDNSGTIVNSSGGGSFFSANPAVTVNAVNFTTTPGTISIANSGSITGGGLTAAAYGLFSTVTLGNTGLISSANRYTAAAALSVYAPAALSATNSGTISHSADGGVALRVSSVLYGAMTSGAVTVGNSGTISAGGSGAAALVVQMAGPQSYGITNSGVLRADGGALVQPFDPYAFASFVAPGTYSTYSLPATALLVLGDGQTTGTVTNQAGGIIQAGGAGSTALIAQGTPLNLINAGTISGGAGVTLDPTDYAVAVTGSTYRAGAVQVFGAGGSTLVNRGTIIGSIDLGGGGNSVTNSGTIRGAVFLHGGGNSFTQAAPATLAGTVDGGDGTNALLIDATGGGSINAASFTHFASATQTGTGTVTYAGTLLAPTLNLNGGGANVAAGTSFAASGPTAITGGANAVSVSNAGTINGAVTFGSGDDQFYELAGSTVTGGVDGGAGANTYHVVLSGDRTGIGARRNFSTLAVEGSGNLTLGSAYVFDQTTANNTLVITGGGLTVPNVVFGAGNDRLMIGGQFNGSADGGAGTDAVVVSGGSEANPIRIGSLLNFETYSQSAGVARLSGRGTFASIDLTGGRLVGEAGSLIAAPLIMVRPGATFGSAGTVIGNITVGGVLSPGASPGTMTVTGNLTLAAGSVSYFEITPTVSDQLLVSGTITIAPGATLQFAPTGAVTPGSVRNLIVASGGVSGNFTTVVLPGGLQGYVVPVGNRIELLGALTVPQISSGDPLAGATADYLNARLQAGNAGLLATLPRLLDANSGLSATALARLGPQPYAAAVQLGTTRALLLADALRGEGMVARSTRPHLFAFGQFLGDWEKLHGGGGVGIAPTRSYSHGGFGGLGLAGPSWSLGAFVGSLDSTQSLADLGASNGARGTFGGVQGQLDLTGARIAATLIYDGARGSTTRPLADGATGMASYGMHGWSFSLAGSAPVPLAGGWQAVPHVELTYVATQRDAVDETGGALALSLAREQHKACLLATGLRLGRAEASTALFRPWLDLGIRSQLAGRMGQASAGFAGGPLTLIGHGAERAPVMASLQLGAEWRLAPGLTAFASGSLENAGSDSRQSLQSGVRVRF